VMLWERTYLSLLGVDIGWYGIAGLIALISGPLLYGVVRRGKRSGFDSGIK